MTSSIPAVFVLILCFHCARFSKLSQKFFIMRESVRLPRFAPMDEQKYWRYTSEEQIFASASFPEF